MLNPVLYNVDHLVIRRYHLKCYDHKLPKTF